MALTKLGVKMPKLCRDTASDTVLNHSSKFVYALNDNYSVYQRGIHNFFPVWSEDNLGQICPKTF